MVRNINCIPHLCWSNTCVKKIYFICKFTATAWNDYAFHTMYRLLWRWSHYLQVQVRHTRLSWRCGVNLWLWSTLLQAAPTCVDTWVSQSRAVQSFLWCSVTRKALQMWLWHSQVGDRKQEMPRIHAWVSFLGKFISIPSTKQNIDTLR